MECAGAGLSRRAGEPGFTLLEVMVGMLLLTAIVVIMSQGYMTAFSRAQDTKSHSLAAAWAQAMIEHVRGQGYGVSGSWTETPASCTAPEPCLPPEFASADVAVTAAGVTGLKRIDITVYRGGAPFLAVATYLADVRLP